MQGVEFHAIYDKSTTCRWGFGLVPGPLSRHVDFYEMDENIKESVVGLEPIYYSSKKCQQNVTKKGSTQAFMLNRLKESYILSKELETGTYVPGPTYEIPIKYPKPRDALSNTFRDRVYQRSLNDHSLYPQITKRFIQNNMACQKGKGTTKARKCFRDMIHSEYSRYGNKIFIFEGDIRQYYNNMLHSETEKIFVNNVDPWTSKESIKVLNNQYAGEKGYKPGSQMVQIAGVSYLDPLDHFIKDFKRVKHYVRVMDDFRIVSHNLQYLESLLREIEIFLKEYGLTLHPKKTRIIPASKGSLFLGFIFRLSSNGKVVMSVDPHKVKQNRKKLYRMVQKAKKGLIDRIDCDNSVECMIAHMKEGDSYILINKFLEYYLSLWEDAYENT